MFLDCFIFKLNVSYSYDTYLSAVIRWFVRRHGRIPYEEELVYLSHKLNVSMDDIIDNIYFAGRNEAGVDYWHQVHLLLAGRWHRVDGAFVEDSRIILRNLICYLLH